MIITGWRPKKRSVYYSDKPEWVPGWVYTEALAAKKFYNENWEFWVHEVAREYNCPVPEAEDACIRGLKKVIDQIQYSYSKTLGPEMGFKIAAWYREFMGMDELFKMVRHPEIKVD